MPYAVIGRLNGDDEDTCHIYDCDTPRDAYAAFVGDMHDRLKAELFKGELTRSDLKNNPIYVNQILHSSAPITSIDVNGLEAQIHAPA